jgi:hypothetical protein
MAIKKDLSEYISTAQHVTPASEVTFRSMNNGDNVTERVAKRTYTAKPVAEEPTAKPILLNAHLTKVADEAVINAAMDDLNDIEQVTVTENTIVKFDTPPTAGDGESSPMTHVPNAQHEAPTTAQLSETALLIQLVTALITKVDEMQNFNPVIHVPAPVIHVTMPETKRTVTKAVERDENNWIKSVTEQIEETPVGEPLIEVNTNDKTLTKRKKK